MMSSSSPLAIAPCSLLIETSPSSKPKSCMQHLNLNFHLPHSISSSFSRISAKSGTLKTTESDHKSSSFEVRGISYRPPGTQHNLLNDVNLSLPEKSFGLIFGRSGSGKTTLLQLLAGLAKPTSGSIYIKKFGNEGSPNQPPETLSAERVGIVFQFPERYKNALWTAFMMGISDQHHRHHKSLVPNPNYVGIGKLLITISYLS